MDQNGVIKVDATDSEMRKSVFVNTNGLTNTAEDISHEVLELKAGMTGQEYQIKQLQDLVSFSFA